VKGYHRKANAEFLLGELDAATASIREGLKRDPSMADLGKLLRKIKAKKAGPAGGRRAPAMDASLRQELNELNEQYNGTNIELMEVKAKLEACARETRRTDLTKDEIGRLPEETPLFRSVGKMFLRAPRPAIAAYLDEQLGVEAKKQADLAARQTYLTRRLQAQETHLKDLMATLTGVPVTA
jgi:chaperonin cofactor prefoldin